MKTRNLTLVLALAALIALALPATAMANFAIHGNYVADTDACAGCHRAHTSYSSVTWTDNNDVEQSALLIGDAAQLWEFCYACHDATSQGADTNVEDGVYEGDLYGETGATLNGGGFGNPDLPTGDWTSTHMVNGASWGAYGGGDFPNDEGTLDYLWGQGDSNFPFPGATAPIAMDCGTCHDPHGSPNYRLLKSQVDGEYVGGYVGAGSTPDGFVSSVETGWPVNGFELHQDYPGYVPNYTTAYYAKGYDQQTATLANPATGINALKGMSGWCAGCHDHYISAESTYNAGDVVPGGLMLRHRHPMNVELDNYEGPDRDNMMAVVASLPANGLPVANDIDEQSVRDANNFAPAEATDWIECLTCHRAHGTKATMEGYASEDGMESVVDSTGVPSNPYVGSEVSALLRLNNRGVCEGCHNK